MASQIDIFSDLSSFTKIPHKTFEELVKKENLCIGSAIHDAILSKEDVAVLDIGIGTLSVELSTMQSKFVPSRELKNIIKKSIDEKIDPMEIAVEQSLIEKLLRICEDAV